MAGGIATLTFKATLNTGGDRAQVDETFTLSGLRVIAGPGTAYLSATSASMKFLKTSGLYGVFLQNLSGKSTGTPALYGYSSGHTVGAKASALFRVNEGQWAFFRPLCATNTHKLWCSTCGLSYRYLLLGV